MINIKDANGKWAVIDENRLIEDLAFSKFKILGMGINQILLLLEMYECMGGVLPITEKSIKAAKEQYARFPFEPIKGAKEILEERDKPMKEGNDGKQ